jgi:transposase-like protein
MAPRATERAGRTVLPKATKQEVVNKLLAGTATVDEVVKKLGVQQYQVFAWVGAYALAKRESLARMGVASVDPELARIIGEYYLQKGLSQPQQ